MLTHVAIGSVHRVRLGAMLGGVAVLVAGCGGGGDGPDASTADFPVASAVSAYVQASHQFDLAGSLDGVAFSASYSYTPGAAAAFEGKPASTAIETVSIRAAAGTPEQTTVRSFFLASPYRVYGSIDLADGAYSVFDQVADLPATARVGQSGTLGSETDYADSSKAVVTGTATTTWSLEADTATTALFCANVTIPGPPSMTGSQCYRVTTNGQVTGMVIKVQVLGKTLVLQ